MNAQDRALFTAMLEKLDAIHAASVGSPKAVAKSTTSKAKTRGKAKSTTSKAKSKGKAKSTTSKRRKQRFSVDLDNLPKIGLKPKPEIVDYTERCWAIVTAEKPSDHHRGLMRSIGMSWIPSIEAWIVAKSVLPFESLREVFGNIRQPLSRSKSKFA